MSSTPKVGPEPAARWLSLREPVLLGADVAFDDDLEAGVALLRFQSLEQQQVPGPEPHLAKPENREKQIYIVGIERVRYRRPAHPGDVIHIEVSVKRLRSRMGQLHGVAMADGKVVLEGRMTFALGPTT